ncbi:hypothetical protein hbim_05451 [Mycolicibacterium mageritense]|uniref:Uncharacterized protein n=2 Tax=Mycolicibacterium mageritense TaxID=53462 RepID=A0AAI8XQY2_MYCME|nr:hypothetical protein hbim_05451 [Mycolicibacterium mageritense]
MRRYGTRMPDPSRPPRRGLWWALSAVTAIAAVIGGAVVITYLTRDRGPQVIVLRPVDMQGNVQNGWQQAADHSTTTPIDCTFGAASPYDVDSSVRSCGATAESGDACWPAADSRHVLCVRDPFARVVDLLPADGLTTPRKPAERPYRPFALILDDGTRCRARIGGAWASPVEQPDWVGYYWCGTTDAVWAPPNGDGRTSDGIMRSRGEWSVMVGPAAGPLTKHRVAQVFYVGVAKS